MPTRSGPRARAASPSGLRSAPGIQAGQVELDQAGDEAGGPVGLIDRFGPEVDALVVEGPERGQGLGLGGPHAHHAGGGDGLHHGGDEPVELGAAVCAHHLGDRTGQVPRVHHTGRDRVLEVVADVGDAVGPADDLALGRRRRGTAPRVVADAVEGLGAQVERCQHHVGPVDGVVVAASTKGDSAPPRHGRRGRGRSRGRWRRPR
jgi:hypothetical protein